MLKRFIALISTLAIATSMLAGCGSGAKKSSGADTSGDKNKEPVTINFWFPGENKVSDEYFVNIGKEFESKFPNIKVNATVLPTANMDVDTKLNAAQLSGTFPDVFISYLLFMGTRGPKGDFLDLKPYIDKWEDKSDIFQSAYDMGTFKGQNIGLGFYPAPELLVYRKDFYKEAGLDPEKPPKNWEELAQFAEKLTVRDAGGKVTRAGFDIPALRIETFIKPWMKQNGSLVVDEKNEVPSFTDKGAIEALDFIVNLKNKNVSIPYDNSKKEDTPFVKGNSAMSILLVNQISKMIANDASIKDKIGFVPVFERKNKVAFSGYRLFTVGAKTKYKDESWEFIKFMMSKEQMQKRMKELNIAPVRTSLEKEFIAADSNFNKAIIEYVKFGKGNEIVPWISVANKYLEDAYQSAYSGKKTSEQALKDAETNLKREIENMKK